jgi:hypothetical protein
MKTKFLIATDLGSFKAYKLEDDRPYCSPRLELVEHYIPEAARRKISDKLTDLAGRFRNPRSGAGAPRGDRHNLELEERKRLIRLLARRLNGLLAKPDVDGCYFAAGRAINREILNGLTSPARAKIQRNIQRDLSKTAPARLLEYFGVDDRH